MTDRDYLFLAVEQAKESVKQGGFPAGAILVKDHQIIAKGISIGGLLHDPTAHAESATVRAACKILQSTDLQGATLYASLQPCMMCYHAVNWAHVDRIVYGCKKTPAMIEKRYYEGKNIIEDVNAKNTYQLALVYMPDFESEMLNLITIWEKQLA